MERPTFRKEPLLARRAPQVSNRKKTSTTAWALMVDTTYGVPVVHHGGDLVGYHSDMMWLPEQNVGLVILTNADPGWLLRDRIRRKLLELLFDGHPEAEAQLNADAKSFYARPGRRAQVDDDPGPMRIRVPSSPNTTRMHRSEKSPSARPELLQSSISASGKARSPAARIPMAPISFITTVPGGLGFEFVVGSGTRRTLTIRDAQHEYVFEER